jgi:virulence-associated protein VapD
MTNEKRSIRAIAFDIKTEWAKVNYAAKPYLDAMLELDSINDKYGFDNARSIILYFLSNASSFRGEKAKALKAELKALGV